MSTYLPTVKINELSPGALRPYQWKTP